MPGLPDTYTVSGTCGVERLLPAPAPLVVTSTSAADAGTVTVTIEGLDAIGHSRRQAVPLLGMALVPVPVDVVPWLFGKAMTGAAQPATELTSSVGTVSLQRAVEADLVASLLPYESAIEHQVFTLYPTPSLPGEQIVVPYLRALTRSLYDGDPIPRDWQEAVFEEMTIQWRVNTGEMAADSLNVVRPKFLDLLAFEQADRLSRPQTRPFLDELFPSARCMSEFSAGVSRYAVPDELIRARRRTRAIPCSRASGLTRAWWSASARHRLVTPTALALGKKVDGLFEYRRSGASNVLLAVCNGDLEGVRQHRQLSTGDGRVHAGACGAVRQRQEPGRRDGWDVHAACADDRARWSRSPRSLWALPRRRARRGWPRWPGRA